MPLAPYKLDILAIFTDLNKAIDIVPVLIKAGLNPTSVEFMANEFVRSASDYCELKLPHYEDGNYVIITVETFLAGYLLPEAGDHNILNIHIYPEGNG